MIVRCPCLNALLHIAPGVDADAEAVDDANRSATLNATSNAHYHVLDLSTVADIPSSLLPSHGDVVVVDPPRVGLHPKFVSLLKSVRGELWASCPQRTGGSRCGRTLLVV